MEPDDSLPCDVALASSRHVGLRAADRKPDLRAELRDLGNESLELPHAQSADSSGGGPDDVRGDPAVIGPSAHIFPDDRVARQAIVQIHTSLASAYANAGRFEQAVAEMDAALALAPPEMQAELQRRRAEYAARRR